MRPALARRRLGAATAPRLGGLGRRGSATSGLGDGRLGRRALERRAPRRTGSSDDRRLLRRRLLDRGARRLRDHRAASATTGSSTTGSSTAWAAVVLDTARPTALGACRQAASAITGSGSAQASPRPARGDVHRPDDEPMSSPANGASATTSSATASSLGHLARPRPPPGRPPGTASSATASSTAASVTGLGRRRSRAPTRLGDRRLGHELGDVGLDHGFFGDGSRDVGLLDRRPRPPARRPRRRRRRPRAPQRPRLRRPARRRRLRTRPPRRRPRRSRLLDDRPPRRRSRRRRLPRRPLRRPRSAATRLGDGRVSSLRRPRPRAPTVCVRERLRELALERRARLVDARAQVVVRRLAASGPPVRERLGHRRGLLDDLFRDGLGRRPLRPPLQARPADRLFHEGRRLRDRGGRATHAAGSGCGYSSGAAPSSLPLAPPASCCAELTPALGGEQHGDARPDRRVRAGTSSTPSSLPP